MSGRRGFQYNSGSLALNRNTSIKQDYFKERGNRHYTPSSSSQSSNGKMYDYSAMLQKKADAVQREIRFLQKRQEALKKKLGELEEKEDSNENKYVDESIDEVRQELQRVSKELSDDVKQLASLGNALAGGSLSGFSGSSNNSGSSENNPPSESMGISNCNGSNSTLSHRHGSYNANSNTGIQNDVAKRQKIDKFLETKEKIEDKIPGAGQVMSKFAGGARRINKFNQKGSEEANDVINGNPNYDPGKKAQEAVKSAFQKANDIRRKANSAIISIANLAFGPIGGLAAFLIILIVTIALIMVLMFGSFFMIGSTSSISPDTATNPDANGGGYEIPLNPSGMLNNGSETPLTVPLYYQKNYNVPISSKYLDKTIASSGCGFCTMAMVVSALTGNYVTPVDIANKYGDAYYVYDGGISHAAFSRISSDYGLKCTTTSSTDRNAIFSCLRNGGLVVISVHNKPFTAGGHIMLLRGVTSDYSQFYIASSSSAKKYNNGVDVNSQTWPVDTVLNAILKPGESSETVYLITK